MSAEPYNRPWNGALGDERPRVMETFSRLIEEGLPRRIWGKDATLWRPDGSRREVVMARLGWLTAASDLRPHVPELQGFARQIVDAGYTQAVLLGADGSALAVDSLRQAIGPVEGFPALRVLAGAEPAALSATEDGLDLATCLFIVASQYGEGQVLSNYHHFYDALIAQLGDGAGEHFVAITDEDSTLEAIGHDRHFRRVFEQPREMGSRHSALSYFGLVPAAVMGLDLATLLRRTEAMARACGDRAPAEENPGLQLGATIAALAQAGRGTLILEVPPLLSQLGRWIEALLRRSLGTAITPVVAPATGDDGGSSGDLRIRVQLGDAQSGEPSPAGAGQLSLQLTLGDCYDLGAESFRWEFSVAVAAAALGIDPYGG